MGVRRTNYALGSQSVLVAKFMELRCIFKVLHLVQMMHLFVFVGVGICKKKSFVWKCIFLGGVAFTDMQKRKYEHLHIFLQFAPKRSKLA